MTAAALIQQKVKLFKECKQCSEKIWDALQKDDLNECSTLLKEREEMISSLEQVDRKIAQEEEPAITKELQVVIEAVVALDNKITLAMKTRKEYMAGEMKTLHKNSHAIRSYLR